MLDTEVIAILRYLLPGFVAAAVYYTFTSHPRPSPFERVVQALVFTIVVEAIAAAVGFPHGDNVAVSVGIAVVVGVVISAVVNHDLVHGAFRLIGVTRETSFPTEWHSTFAQRPQTYVLLHFTDGRRLVGWPAEWPGSPDHGHFRIEEGEWIADDGRRPTGHTMLVPVKEIEVVEFFDVGMSK